MGTLEMEEMINKFNVLTDKPVKYLTVQDDIKEEKEDESMDGENHSQSDDEKSRKDQSTSDDDVHPKKHIDVTKKQKKNTKKTKEEKSDIKKKEDSDEESIDMFEDIDDVVSADEESNEKDMMYSDFFNGDADDDNEETDENSSEKETVEKPNKSDKKVRFAAQDELESDSGDDAVSEEVDELKNKFNDEEKKSEFEKRQERLKQQISKLEEKTLKEAPWQLKGEVDASTRPQNSLLQEVVDFDLTTRPPPIITEQTTYTLEDIIMRRVKDKAWDDVVKKEKPVDDQLAFRKPEVLDHSKSKLSLAQVYEAEYLKQKQALTGDNEDEKEPEAHTELRNAMSQLFSKLDALCHYHYTPKPPQAEVKIVSNTPAISMEEVAPVATSDAALLAPEEVKKKRRGELLSKEERTQTDKKRERRKKKKLQRLKGNMTKVTEQRNTKKATEATDKSLKTSKAFFQQLNDNSTSIIKLKRKNKGQ
ncbi:unnamed protein product, partial [Iphiclides podalirius]